MKTLGQFQAERNKVQKVEAEAHVKRCRALLASIQEQEIPVYAPPVPARCHAADDRVTMRERLKEGGMIPIELACDHCGTELVNRRPGWYAASKPKKYSIGCPGCGWTGWLRG
jgi:hypothetical protein